MKNIVRVALLLICVTSTFAQNRMLEAESSSTTKHTVTVKNKLIPYSATAGTQPVWDKDGEVIASFRPAFAGKPNGDQGKDRRR